MTNPKYFLRLTDTKEQSIFKAVLLLEKWLDNLLLSGISVLQQDSEKFTEISTRMLDLGLAGISKKLRLVPEKVQKSKDWTEFAVLQISELYLFIKLMNKIEHLNHLEKEDLLNYAGIPFKKTDFTEDYYLQDDWLFIGNSREKEENLVIIRNWFYGAHSGKLILYLEYQFNQFVQLKAFKLGSFYQATVQFYPSVIFQRIRDMPVDNLILGMERKLLSKTVESSLEEYISIITLNPMIRQFCFVLKDIKFTKSKEQWFISSKGNQWVQIMNSEAEIVKMLSYSSNKDFLIIGEYSETKFRVLAAVLDSIIIPI
ncbi:MAG: hypothetical protein IPG12_09825 [Saprospiraceae bacterium]|nr:hypothetical protein [Saprospiraceae bacterium]